VRLRNIKHNQSVGYGVLVINAGFVKCSGAATASCSSRLPREGTMTQETLIQGCRE
jgi:hypothetical protein